MKNLNGQTMIKFEGTKVQVYNLCAIIDKGQTAEFEALIKNTDGIKLNKYVFSVENICSRVTPLMVAVAKQNEEIVNMLTHAHEINPSVKPFESFDYDENCRSTSMIGFSSIQLAVKYPSTRILELILEGYEKARQNDELPIRMPLDSRAHTLWHWIARFNQVQHLPTLISFYGLSGITIRCRSRDRKTGSGHVEINSSKPHSEMLSSDLAHHLGHGDALHKLILLENLARLNVFEDNLSKAEALGLLANPKRLYRDLITPIIRKHDVQAAKIIFNRVASQPENMPENFFKLCRLLSPDLLIDCKNVGQLMLDIAIQNENKGLDHLFSESLSLEKVRKIAARLKVPEHVEIFHIALLRSIFKKPNPEIYPYLISKLETIWRKLSSDLKSQSYLLLSKLLLNNQLTTEEVPVFLVENSYVESITLALRFSELAHKLCVAVEITAPKDNIQTSGIVKPFDIVAKIAHQFEKKCRIKSEQEAIVENDVFGNSRQFTII